jgi:hypothetical protein
MTLDKRLYFPSEGRHTEGFFARKIRRLRSGANPRSWVPEASMLTTRPTKPLVRVLYGEEHLCREPGVLSDYSD